MRLVYLSPVPWNSIAQRPHFFVKAALRSGFTSILWVEPTPSRLPQLKDFRSKLLANEPNSFSKPDQLHIIKPRCIPIEPLGAIYDVINCNMLSSVVEQVKEFCRHESTVLTIGKPSRLALKILATVDFSKTIFDVMDDFPQFFHGISARSMSEHHRYIINIADMCLFSSRNLKNKYEQIARSSALILNACDDAFYEKCQLYKKTLTPKTRIFGYVGSIADWFDWGKVIELANDNPNDKVVIVGPNHASFIPVLPQNVELHRGVQHSEIPKILSSFDFGLIPFKINELTDSVDPVKYYEYSAVGLPVITTEFGEMKERVIKGYAISFNQFKIGIQSMPEPVIFWGERFKFLSDILNAL